MPTSGSVRTTVRNPHAASRGRRVEIVVNPDRRPAADIRRDIWQLPRLCVRAPVKQEVRPAGGPSRLFGGLGEDELWVTRPCERSTHSSIFARNGSSIFSE